MPEEISTMSNGVAGTSKRRLSLSPFDSDASDSGEPTTKRAKEVPAEEDSHRIAEDNSPRLDINGSIRDKKRRKKKRRKQSIIQPRARSVEKAAVPGSKTAVDSELIAMQKARSTSPVARVAPSRAHVLQPASPAASPTAIPRSASRTYTECGVETEAQITPPKIDKGKQRAITPPPEPDSADLAAHHGLTANLFPSLTCQICLLLMHRPFALAPCGHVACHSCLVSWFVNEPGNLNQAALRPTADSNGDVGPAASGDPGPASHASSSAVRRKKTCPHCRAVVRERPVEVWVIKDMVIAVVKSGLADADAIPLELRPDSAESSRASSGSNTPKEDPWKDVFPPLIQPGRGGPGTEELGGVYLRERWGIRDDEDGGIYRCVDCAHEIWEGVCSACGRVYTAHRPANAGGGGGDVGGVHFGLEDLLGARLEWGDVGDDEEDDVDIGFDEFDLFRRLSYPTRRYMDVTTPSDEEIEEGEGDEPRLRDLDGDEDDEGAEEDEQGYESSFIDDEEDEIVEVPAPAALARGRRRPPAPIVVSDSDDGDVQIVRQGRRGPAPRRRVLVVPSDHEDEGLLAHDDEGEAEDGSEDLAAAVAERERELYGDDGSLPARRHRRTRVARGMLSEDESSDAHSIGEDTDWAHNDAN